LYGFKLPLDGSQSILCRYDRFDNLLDDPDEDVLLGVNVVEGETFKFAVVADEPLLCENGC